MQGGKNTCPCSGFLKSPLTGQPGGKSTDQESGGPRFQPLQPQTCLSGFRQITALFPEPKFPHLSGERIG